MRKSKLPVNQDISSDEDELSSTNSSKDLKQTLLRKNRSASAAGNSNDEDIVSETRQLKKQRSKTEVDKGNQSERDNHMNSHESDVESVSSYTESRVSTEDGIGGSRRKLINRKGFSKFSMHLKLLLMKNYWIFRRNIKITMVQLLAPVFFCLLILFFQFKSTQWLSQEVYHPTQNEIGRLPTCQGDPDCVTVGYSIIGDPDAPNDRYAYIHDIMKNLAHDNQLKYNQDVKLLTVGTPGQFYDYVQNNQNMTWYSVIWCTTEWKISDQVSLPCRYTHQGDKTGKSGGKQKMMFYSVYYNFSMEDNAFFKAWMMPAPIDPVLLRVKLSVDNSIMQYLGHQKGMESDQIPQIELTHSSYPIIADRVIKDANLVSQLGPYFLVLGPLLSFTIMLNEIVREKELRLRQGLQVVGVGHSVYWLSWIIVGIVFSAMTSLVLLISGHLCNFDIFWNVPILINFMIFFFFSLAMISLAFMVSTLVQSQASANQVAYTFVLVTIIFQIMFSQNNVNHILLYNDSNKDTFAIKTTRMIFYGIPSFTLSVCFGVVIKVASTHLDPQLVIWVNGLKYHWEDFFTSETGSFVGGMTYTLPSAFELMLIMIWDTVIFLLLTWYFDHVIAHNRGVADSPIFLFTKHYWQSWLKVTEDGSSDQGSDDSGERTQTRTKEQQEKDEKRKKRRRDAADFIDDYQQDISKEGSHKNQKNSVKKEKKKVIDAEREGVLCEGLRVMGLKKTYFQKSFGRKSDKDVHAVRGIYLEVPDHELLCLLGHNGAGKSTLFSMLTGVTKPTEGSAKICGFDIESQIDEIRLIMGVVPQFDILWGELTAAEHMTMFSMIKGVHNDDIDEMTDELLESVGLLQVKHARVMNFSGGMKRRLSVAISSIGNPRIIFMDEPTTGMDPVSRRDVWNLIQRLKRNKVIVLTTHAMEEADILSDRLAVVCDGKLKCVGTPLYLKNTYGDGYRISLVCEAGNEQKIIDLMSQVSPSSKLLDESGGSMVFAVPINNTQEISKLFSLIEEADPCLIDGGGASDSLLHIENPQLRELKTHLKDIGISHTTLEEVFMKVTGKKSSKYVTSQQPSSLSQRSQVHPIVDQHDD